MADDVPHVALPGTPAYAVDNEQENPHVSYTGAEDDDVRTRKPTGQWAHARRPARPLRPLPNLNRLAPVNKPRASGETREIARAQGENLTSSTPVGPRMMMAQASAAPPQTVLVADTPALPIADDPDSQEVDAAAPFPAALRRRRSSTGDLAGADPYPMRRRSSAGSYDVISTNQKQLSSVRNPALGRMESTGTSNSETPRTRQQDRRGSAASVQSDDSMASIVSTAWYEERQKTRRSSIGETSRSRWAKANWYALERAGSSDPAEEELDDPDDNSPPRGTIQIGTMVNVIMFAMHWRQRALGDEAGARDLGSPMAQRKGAMARAGPAVERLALLWGYLRWTLTAYITLAWDINVLVDPSGAADRALHAVSTGALGLFLVDFVARLWVRNMKVLSSECAVDLLSMLSLLPDAVFFLSGATLLVDAATRDADAAAGSQHAYHYWPVGVRALRAGFRISRGVGIISLMLRQQQAEKQQAKVPEDLKRHMEENPTKQTRMAVNTLVDIQTAGLVGALLGLHYVLRWLLAEDTEGDAGLAALLTVVCRQHAAGGGGGEGGDIAMGALSERAALAELPVLYLLLGGVGVLGSAEELEGKREYPPAVVTYEAWGGQWLEGGGAGGGGRCVMHVDGTRDLEREARASLVLSVTVVFVMLSVTRSIRTVFDREVVVPLEAMERRVMQMLRNPLRRRNIGKHRHVRESLVVENAVTKFASLLRISLGEAGGRIVTANLNAGNIDRNLPGKIVNAIFGFCDIRNFTDLTEVLQADIVKLVNTVALSVHTAVTSNYGAPNKNIGDAFLLVWKPNKGKQVQEVGDSALRALLHTILALKSSQELSRIARRQEIQSRLPGYRVTMGFGLHYGWAVEGAIGSHQKIDASYLSPHVNLSSRLESATKQYGVPLLVSESMRKLLSQPVQRVLRLVDRVIVKGSAAPIKLYTYDAWALGTSLGAFDSSKPTEGEALGGRQEGTAIANGVDLSKLSVTSFFAVVPPSSTEEYRAQFLVAMDAYLGGDNGQNANWQTAQVLFTMCIAKCPEDGVAKALLRYIESHCEPSGMQPAGWPGYRELDSK